MKTIVILERGIYGWQGLLGDWKNWPNAGVAWFHNNTDFRAQTLTYFTGPILAGATRNWRAGQFADLIGAYKDDDWRIVMGLHSEGTATGLRALQLARYPKVDEIHLFCGACNADYTSNGLNQMVALDRVRRIVVRIATQDGAIKLENSYPGSICFGLQCSGTPLGLKGPENMTTEATRRTEIYKWLGYGHSDCFLPENFVATMQTMVS